MRFDFEKNQFLDLQKDHDKVALVGTDRRLTWADLSREVQELCVQIQSLKVDPKSPVLIYGHKECSMVTGILACYFLRIPYIPVDRLMPDSRVQRIVEIAGVKIKIEAAGSKVDALKSMTVDATPLSPHPQEIAEDLAYIIFTSGSTGEPKGVQITRANVVDLATWVQGPDFSFSNADVLLNQCSFSFDVSLFDVIATMSKGSTLVLNGPAELESEQAFRKRITDLEPTHWSSTPSFLSLALTSQRFNSDQFPNLTKFYVAGEAVHAELVKRFWRKFADGQLWNAYGPTEATVITTLIHLDKETVDKYPLLPIGRVKPGVTMPTLTNDKLSEGELLIIGKNVSPGYLNRADLNASRFENTLEGRLYKTGDIGFHQDGLVFCKGRIDSQIKLHGYRIELDEIDSVLSGLEFVKTAATIGLKRAGVVKKLVSFVELTSDYGASDWPAVEEQIRLHLGTALPYYMIPAEIRRIELMPYNANHKIDRGALEGFI